MKSVNRDGFVYPKTAPQGIQLKHIYEAVAPPLYKSAALAWEVARRLAGLFKAPRFYTQDYKATRGGFFHERI